MKLTKTIKPTLIKQNPIRKLSKTNFFFSSKPLLPSKEEQALLNKENLIKTVQFHISGIDHNQIKGAKKGDSRLYVVSFECKICNKRNTKTCTHTAYHKGLVVIRCDECSSYHLIADNLGWVKDVKDVKDDKNDKENLGKVCLNEPKEFGDDDQKSSLIIPSSSDENNYLVDVSNINKTETKTNTKNKYTI